MKARWICAIGAVALAGLIAFAFAGFFSGFNLDSGMIVRRVTWKGALWVGMDGNPRNVYLEPLGHFLSGAAGVMAMFWTLAAAAMGPVGYLLGWLWEGWRDTRGD